MTTAPALYHMSIFQAIVIGLIQGLTELFPISSLGHTVLIPSWLGGTWATLVRQESMAESPYLAFVVGLHLATAQSRVLFAKPLAAALFLAANGAILLAGERHRRRRATGTVPDPGGAQRQRVDIDPAATHELAAIGLVSAGVIGASQALALLAGISREGVAMVGGLFRGLSNENAMRFSFLLSTPVILAAGALKVPDLLGPLGSGIRPQVLAGAAADGGHLIVGSAVRRSGDGPQPSGNRVRRLGAWIR